jgi:hypothetical protein
VARVTAGRGGRPVQWASGQAAIPPAMTHPEALFWLEAMTRETADVTPQELARADQPPAGDLTLAMAKSRIQRQACELTPEIVAPLVALLPPQDFVALMLAEDLVGSGEVATEAHLVKDHVQTCLVEGFARYVLPYLSPAEAAWVRSALRLEPDPGRWPKTGPVTPLPVAWRLAALLGMPDELLELVSRLGPGRAARGREAVPPFRAQELVFGLGSARLVRRHLRRLGLRLEEPRHVRAWLAHTTFDALDVVRDGILACADRDRAEALLEVFCRVKAPEAAPLMLELRGRSRVPALARRWLEEQVSHAVTGLLPVAAGQGELAGPALEYLRLLPHRGFAALVEKGLRGLAPEGAGRLRHEVFERGGAPPTPFDEQTAPDWWLKAVCESLGGRPPVRPPAWADPARLPPPAFGNRCLNDKQVRELVTALGARPLRAPLPLVREVKRHGDPAGLDALACRLFELWLAEGPPEDERWALRAAGLLGGDTTAGKLATLLCDGPDGGRLARPDWVLQCLRAIGSDAALMGLDRIARLAGCEAHRGQARQFLREAASERGLSADQLEDRLVPGLGLDARGGRTFTFGPRRFRLVFGPNLTPLLQDESGKVRGGPPPAGAKEDPARVAAALGEWKQLRQQARETVTAQVRRLERAMLSRRRWAAEDFERFLVGHPFLIFLVQRLLWGAYGGGRRTAAFRVTEDRTYADGDDRPYTPCGRAVGVVHPLELTEQEQARWGEVFADYEIIQPFPQLGRGVRLLQPSEAAATVLTRFAGPGIPATGFNGLLEQHGWMTNRLPGPRTGLGHHKRFPQAGLTAIIEERCSGGGMRKIASVFFVPGSPEDGGRADVREALRLGAVDRAVLGEVLGTLEALVSIGT